MWTRAFLGVSAAALLAFGAQAQNLRIGLQEDPDQLDPDVGRTFVGRIVFQSLCDKLVDITPDLKIVPMLATSWEWSGDGKSLLMKLRTDAKYHDGAPIDAASVKVNLERSMTWKGSRRASELTSIAAVTAVDASTVKIDLKAPDATLMAAFTDRAGMMVSPKPAVEQEDKFALNPVCSGPYKFVERVVQDRMVLEKFKDHWNAKAFAFERVTFLPIPDNSVRLANVQSGDLQLIERVAPTDLKTVRADRRLKLSEAVGLGYQGITVNVGNGERSKTPFGQDPRVRKAFELSIDREALNQVVFEGEFLPGNQPWPPTSPWYVKSVPIPKRDVAAAKALLKEAGLTSIEVEMQAAPAPDDQQVAQVLQSMAAEAGINLKIRTTEFATMLKEQTAGNYQMTRVGWSGRTDPDGNIHTFMTCKGGINDSKFCDPKVDELLNKARTVADVAERQKLYEQAIQILDGQRPIIYLYHGKWFYASRANLEGFVAYPDGIIRLAGVTLK
ncbi:MAG: ABC transporter substrate-binding protein [Thalassobaculales bacterium]